MRCFIALRSFLLCNLWSFSLFCNEGRQCHSHISAAMIYHFPFIAHVSLTTTKKTRFLIVVSAFHTFLGTFNAQFIVHCVIFFIAFIDSRLWQFSQRFGKCLLLVMHSKDFSLTSIQRIKQLRIALKNCFLTQSRF